jgi:hypothetical protein
MSSMGSGASSSTRLRYVNKKCKCGRRAAIRCSESEEQEEGGVAVAWKCNQTRETSSVSVQNFEDVYVRAEVLVLKQRVDTLTKWFSLVGFASLMLYFVLVLVLVEKL